MKYSLTDGSLHDLRTPCLVVSLKNAKRVARALGEGNMFSRASQDFKDSKENTLVVHLAGAVARLLIVGGADQTVDADGFRKLTKNAANAMCKLPVKQAVIALDTCKVNGKKTPWKLQTLMHALSYTGYTYTRHKSKPGDPPSLNSVRLHVADKKSAQNSIKLGRV